MEAEVLRKKISSFKTKGGHLRNVSNDILMEILELWENWEGSSKSFYSAIGVSRYKIAVLLGKAKKLKREGYMSNGFEEVKLEPTPLPSCGSYGIELVLDNGKIIRFGGVDLALDFLKKAA